MPKVCRHGDLGATGHGCTTVIGQRASQGEVFCNGIRVSRKGDRAFPHKIRRGVLCVGHSSQINRGSRTVFVKGIPMARVGDSFDRGRMIRGSNNVFAGG